MNTYTKPLPGDFVGVALYAENPRYLQAVTAADIFSRDPQTTVLVAALHVGRKTTVYTAGAAPTANLDAFAVRLRELKKAGKVLVVQETLPTALLLQEQLGITFKRTFSASAWMSHRQYPTAQHVVRGIVGGELRHVDDAGRAAAPGLARARACAQEASDAVAVATLALSDPSFTAMEWQVVEYHARNSLRGIHLDGERAQVLLAEAREQLAAAAAELAEFGFDPRMAGNTTKLVSFIRSRFAVDVDSASKKDVGLVLATRSDADLAAFRAALARLQHGAADVRELAKIGPGLRRVHGALRYGRARTGRLAGGGIDAVINFHGMPKATKDSPARLRQIVVPPPNTLLRRDGRPMPPCEFISLDLKSIEPRVHAYLADQDDLLQRFQAKEDVYVKVAAEIDPDAPRKVGKEAVLGLGFGMGADTFYQRLILGGCDVDFSVAEMAHATYARVFPRMVALRDEYWSAFIAASNGATQSIGKCTFRPAKRHGGLEDEPAVEVELPSGRALFYWYVKLSDTPGSGTYVDLTRNDSDIDKARVDIYPGKLLQNIVQAVARDILMAQVLELEAARKEVQLTVHDEAILVWRPSLLGRSRDVVVAQVKAIMSKVPDSLPLLQEVPVEAEVNATVRHSMGD